MIPAVESYRKPLCMGPNRHHNHMGAVKIIGVAFLLPALLFFRGIPSSTVLTLTGRVINEETRAPMRGVLVYTIEGEEEALTNGKGEFRIQTRRSFPVKVTAEQLIGKKQKVQIIATSSFVLFELP